MRTSTPVALMNSSEYSDRKLNFLFRFSKPIPRQDDLDRAGSGVVLKLVPPERSASSDKAALAAWAALSRSGPLRLSGEPALFI